MHLGTGTSVHVCLCAHVHLCVSVPAFLCMHVRPCFCVSACWCSHVGSKIMGKRYQAAKRAPSTCLWMLLVHASMHLPMCTHYGTGTSVHACLCAHVRLCTSVHAFLCMPVSTCSCVLHVGARRSVLACLCMQVEYRLCFFYFWLGMFSFVISSMLFGFMSFHW